MGSRGRPVGELLRDWRQRRHLSQLELALEAGVSTRHLSFVETGRSRPSREMVLHLAEQLDVPLRERNTLLVAAGYAPAYAESRLDAAEMAPVREALEVVLRGHEPYPALVVDRGWNLVTANRSIGFLTEGVAEELLLPPVNVLRASLHPDGLAPRIINLAEWSSHLLTRLRRQATVTGDDALAALHDELAAYPGVSAEAPLAELEGPGTVAVPLRIRTGEAHLALYSTIATFGTALDLTLAELAIEAFLPADDRTAAALRQATPA
jgi:transcriptional regulator with XRE-family HTH domain